MVKPLLNAAALLIGLIGVVFKANWWAGANVLMLLSFGLLLLAVLIFPFRDNRSVGVSNVLNYALVGTLSLGILNAMSRMIGWQGSELMDGITIGVLVMLCALLLVWRSEVGASRQFLASAFVFFTLYYLHATLPRKSADMIEAEQREQQP
jgi:hypothetical protein